MSARMTGQQRLVAFLLLGAGFMPIVAYMVTATSGLPNSEQGLATGLATLTQRVATTVGVPS